MANPSFKLHGISRTLLPSAYAGLHFFLRNALYFHLPSCCCLACRALPRALLTPASLPPSRDLLSFSCLSPSSFPFSFLLPPANAAQLRRAYFITAPAFSLPLALSSSGAALLWRLYIHRARTAPRRAAHALLQPSPGTAHARSNTRRARPFCSPARHSRHAYKRRQHVLRLCDLFRSRRSNAPRAK